MFTSVKREWQITLPESMIHGIGAGEGSTLACTLEGGEIRLRLASVEEGKKR